jgi:membrane associated rhomboid family serine protease
MHEPLALYTLVVITLTVIISYQGFRREAVLEKFLFEPARILGYKEYYRLVTAGLVHNDWLHLLFNMASLYMFAEEIELFFGPRTFFAIYLSGIVGGSLFALLLHRHHDYRAVGASGGVCGIIFGSIFLMPGSDIRLFGLSFGIPDYSYAILFLAFSFFGMRRQRNPIGHDAHIGGALIGLLATTIMYPHIIRQSRNLYIAVWIIAGLMILYLYRYPLYLPGHGPRIAVPLPSVRRKKKVVASEVRMRDSDEQKLDRLLDKISREGMHSLSMSERKQLEAISQRRQLEE